MVLTLQGNLLARPDTIAGTPVRLDVQLSFDCDQPPPRLHLDGVVTFTLPDLQATRTFSTYTAFAEDFLLGLREVLHQREGWSTLLDGDPLAMLAIGARPERPASCLVTAYWWDFYAVGAPLSPGEYSERAPLSAEPREAAIMWLVEGMCVDYEAVEELAASIERLLSSPGLTIGQDLY